MIPFFQLEIREFQSSYGNSKVSHVSRIKTVHGILKTNAILFVFDNFELAQQESGATTTPFLADLLKTMCLSTCKSKVIITTRMAPNHETKSLLRNELLELQPFGASRCHSEYIPSLPRLSKVLETSPNLTYDQVHAVTGGIPLALNLLEAYLASHNIETAYRYSIEKISVLSP